jgi:hypothetical protein
MIFNRIAVLPVLALGAGLFSQVFAGAVVTGTFAYTQTGAAGDGTCPVTPERISFTGTVSEDGGFSDYNLSFSLCDTPATITGGEFSLTGGTGDVDNISGTFSGSDDGTTTIDSVVYEIEDGVFTLTPGSGTGIFTGDTGSEEFTAYADEAGTGSFIVGAPEPATLALTGLGFLAIGIAKKRRKTAL